MCDGASNKRTFWSCTACEYRGCKTAIGGRINWCNTCNNDNNALWNAIFETYTGVDMCDSASDFSGVKVGDKLWSVGLGVCKVSDINYRDETIRCDCGFGHNRYNFNGTVLRSYGNKEQQLFWSRPEIIAPPKPKRKVVKEVGLYAVVNEHGQIIRTIGLDSANHPRIDENGDLIGGYFLRLTGTYEVFE